MRRYVIVANPIAGKGKGLRMAQAVHERLRERGAQSDLRQTSAKGEAEAIIAAEINDAAAAQQLCVVPCGGDGSVQEAVNALAACPQSGAVLGLAPAGRCNDFAAALGVQAEPDHIAETLLHGTARRVDIARANEHYFCTIAAMGFDAQVSRYVNDSKLPVSGTAAYVLGTLRTLLKFRPVPVSLHFDHETFEGPIFLAASANTPSYGGQMRIAPGASTNDGLLDVCVISPVSRLRGVKLLRAVLTGQHVTMPEVRILRTRKLRIETPDPQEIWADGEFVASTPVTIEVMPRAVEILLASTETSKLQDSQKGSRT